MVFHTLHTGCGGTVELQTKRFFDRIEFTATCDKCAVRRDATKVLTRRLSVPWGAKQKAGVP